METSPILGKDLYIVDVQAVVQSGFRFEVAVLLLFRSLISGSKGQIAAH